MIERYLEDLWAELEAVGIRGRLRRRILLETEDHLRSEPDVERFGSPAVVADRFADELATTPWWTPAVLAVCGAAALPLAWAAVRFLRSVRLQPQAPGPPGDAYDDLGPLARFRSHPWLFCAATTALAALAVFAAGALAGQPDEGLRNAVLEAFWVAAGFSLLGPSLGLRPAAPSR
jgi:hypothetical protein